MGSESVYFTIEKKATKKQIDTAFKKQQKRDREYNGHREGYSGDFQTLRGIDDHTLKQEPFRDFNEALDYCLENSEKWCKGVAVYYLNKENKINTLVAGWGAC